MEMTTLCAKDAETTDKEEMKSTIEMTEDVMIKEIKSVELVNRRCPILTSSETMEMGSKNLEKSSIVKEMTTPCATDAETTDKVALKSTTHVTEDVLPNKEKNSIEVDSTKEEFKSTEKKVFSQMVTGSTHTIPEVKPNHASADDAVSDLVLPLSAVHVKEKVDPEQCISNKELSTSSSFSSGTSWLTVFPKQETSKNQQDCSTIQYKTVKSALKESTKYPLKRAIALTNLKEATMSGVLKANSTSTKYPIKRAIALTNFKEATTSGVLKANSTSTKYPIKRAIALTNLKEATKKAKTNKGNFPGYLSLDHQRALREALQTFIAKHRENRANIQQQIKKQMNQGQSFPKDGGLQTTKVSDSLKVESAAEAPDNSARKTNFGQELETLIITDESKFKIIFNVDLVVLRSGSKQEKRQLMCIELPLVIDKTKEAAEYDLELMPEELIKKVSEIICEKLRETCDVSEAVALEETVAHRATGGCRAPEPSTQICATQSVEGSVDGITTELKGNGTSLQNVMENLNTSSAKSEQCSILCLGSDKDIKVSSSEIPPKFREAQKTTATEKEKFDVQSKHCAAKHFDSSSSLLSLATSLSGASPGSTENLDEMKVTQFSSSTQTSETLSLASPSSSANLLFENTKSIISSETSSQEEIYGDTATIPVTKSINNNAPELEYCSARRVHYVPTESTLEAGLNHPAQTQQIAPPSSMLQQLFEQYSDCADGPTLKTVEDFELVRMPFKCPHSDCNSLISLSMFNKHLVEQHFNSNTKRILPKECVTFFLDYRLPEYHKPKCFAFFFARDRVQNITYGKDYDDDMPIVIMCMKVHNLNVFEVKFDLNECTVDDFIFMIWPMTLTSELLEPRGTLSVIATKPEHVTLTSSYTGKIQKLQKPIDMIKLMTTKADDIGSLMEPFNVKELMISGHVLLLNAEDAEKLSENNKIGMQFMLH